MEQKINHSKPHYWSYLSVSDLLVKNMKANKVIHLRIQSGRKNLTHILNLNSLNIVRSILPRHIQKRTHVTNYPPKTFLVGLRKKTWTAPFLDAQEAYSWSTWKANVDLLKNIFVLETQEVFIWCGDE